MRYEAVVIGASAGGIEALKIVLPALPGTFPLPVVIVQHIGGHTDGFLAEYLNFASALTVKEAEDKESLRPGHAYFAPGGYHLLVENDRTLSLSVDPPVHFSCPSIDVLFESAADAFGRALIAAVLTGATSDGAHGLQTVKRCGGLTLAQDPKEAMSAVMPQAAIDAAQPHHIVRVAQIAPLLVRLAAEQAP